MAFDLPLWNGKAHQNVSLTGFDLPLVCLRAVFSIGSVRVMNGLTLLPFAHYLSSTVHRYG